MRNPKPTRFRSKWRIRPTVNGRRESYLFDSLEEAQIALKRFELKLLEQRHGFAQLPSLRRRFDELCEAWLTNRTSQKRNPADDQSIIRAHLIPHLSNTRLLDISPSHIDSYKNQKKSLAPKTVNNHLTLLKSMFNYAIELGWLTVCPRIKKLKDPDSADGTAYLRTQDEIDRLLNTAKSMDETAHMLYATAIYTGLRQGELADLTWADVDFTLRLITVSKSFGGPTKNGKTRVVPIFDKLLPMLIEWRRKNPLEMVFPNKNGRYLKKANRIFQERFKSCLDKVGFPRRIVRGKAKHYIVPKSENRCASSTQFV